MSKSNHPIEQEELMAYLDGELATNRAVAAAAHLEHCAECQELAADLRKLSQEMMAWEVEQGDSASIPTGLAGALAEPCMDKPRKIKKSRLWGLPITPRRLAWSGVLAFFFLLVIGISIPSHLSVDRMRLEGKREKVEISQRAALDRLTILPSASPSAPPKSGSINIVTKSGTIVSEQDSDGDDAYTTRKPELPLAPMIVRTAGLALTTKEFDKTRASLEEILRRHNGYMGELKVNAPTDAGRSLTATLRIPAAQLESALAELKKLGRVENESQGGEEVTQQYVDLQARLANGKHTEQRLTEILRTRTGKLQDVLKVELEIDRVRGEIEQMQAEQKELTKRVAFATLNTTIQEEYFAKLQSTPPSTGSRFRNAAVDGYNTVIEGVIDVALFLLSAGPSLLVWVAILFFPARWVWKKLRRKVAERDLPSAS